MKKTLTAIGVLSLIHFAGISALGGLIGTNQVISGIGGRFPDAAYNSTNSTYLVVWADYNQSPSRAVGRRVDSNGAAIGSQFNISDGVGNGLMPSIAYNTTNNEWLVTWDDTRGGSDHVYGQRVRGSDGVLLGSNFAIGSIVAVRCAVAWSSTYNTYLVVFSDYAEIYGQRVSNTGGLLGGNFNISNDAVFSGLPAVAGNGAQYLVTWDYNPSGSIALIRGCRVDASNGALSGSPFTISGTSIEDRSCLVYDSVNGRYLVQWNQQNPGNSYDQYAQFVSTAGALIGGTIALMNSTDFEGDTQFGGDLAFAPGTNRFFTSCASIGAFAGFAGIELNNATGTVVGTKNILGVADFMSGNCAVDTTLSRFLVCQEGFIGSQIYTSIQLYGSSATAVPGAAGSPSPANGAIAINASSSLSWTAGSGATSRNIYFGTTNPPPYVTTISGTTYAPAMAWDTTYYWRVNEVNAGGTTQGAVWSFNTKSNISINLGNTNTEDMMTSPVGGDGDTIGATYAGRDCRRNMDPSFNDQYFYFTVGDSFAYQGSKADVWIVIQYYDETTTGALTLQYDATSSAYKDGGSILFTGTNTWKTHKWHLTDAYFGNRQNNSSDFRIHVGNVVHYLDTASVMQNTPGTQPPGQASNPSPTNVSTTVGKNDDLSWTAGSGASSHNVYFGTTDPPPFVAAQATTTWDPGTMVAGTTYYWRIDEYATGGGTTTGNVWSFTVRTNVSIDLGTSNVQNGMTNPIGGDGDTVGATIGGRDCRKNMDPGANDYYFYFTVTDSYAYQGNNPDQWISIEYYDNTTGGTLDLAYDATDGNAFKSGGSILLTGTNTWKKHTFHVTDAYFGNRENNGGDFRIAAGAVARYLDIVTVSQVAPSPALPGQASSPSPANAATGVSISATLSWTAGSDATSHNVYFGLTNPPALIGNQAGATYNPGTLLDGTTYYWRIDEVNATGTTTGVVWNFATQASSLTTFSNSAFASTADGWTISVWHAGTLADGTMAFDSSTGNPAGGMKSTGAGITNTTDSCTREGGEIKKLISTAGYNTIQVKYDLRFSTDQSGTTTTGTCTANILEGNCADKVAVYYSTAGTGGPWTLLETVNASSVTQGTFSTRVLNLSAGASDQMNFALRLKFQFNTDTDSAWLDNIKVAGAPLPLPGQASNPNPATTATGVDINADLSWTAGSGAASHDVRFGTVNPPPFVINQAGTSYDPGAMTAGTTYYWRIDEKNGSGTTTGVVWSFTTLAMPGAATAPNPANSATLVPINSSLSWTQGSNTTSHDVHFGTTNPPPFVVNQTGTSYNPGTLSADTLYYWRIDEKNGSGTTTGTVWSFTTLPLPGVATAPNPANAATGVSINADLSWTAGSNAASHNVNFGTTDPPASIGNQAGTSYEPGTLTAGTTYYWSIDEVNGSGTTTGTVWSFTTLPLPGGASGPNPANAATNININADLSWTAGSNATSHNVNFGTTNPPPLIGGQAGTSYDPGTLSANTTYFWRIDEVNGSGTTTGTVWSFSTLPLPGTASGANPANAATGVSITADLSWTAGSNAVSHDVRFGTTNPPPFIVNQAGTTYDSGTMAAGTTYYWRIDEVNSSGTTTGTVWSFTTLPLPGLASAPNPANNATSVSINADLSWTAGSNTTSHDVRFGTVNPPPFVINQTGTTYDPGTMSVGTTYYWRIDEINSSGTTTGTVWSFTTLPLPGAASGPSPANSATSVSITADLAWTAGSNAVSHDVRFGTVNPPPFIQNQAGTTYDTGTMSAGTTYFWRIDEVNGSGTTTGTVWSFTTLPLPGLASGPSPANGATGQSVDVDLAWTAGSNATSHDVRFGTANPPPFVINQAGTSYDPGTLSANTTYYWRIDEKNGSGTTTGTVWSLTTSAVPAAPTVTAPTNGSTVTSLTPTITWTGAAHDQYQVRVSQQNDSSTSTNGWDSGTVTNSGNSAVSGTLRNYSFYYVFVRLHNVGGWGAWSAAGYNFIVNTNATNGTVYLGNALPTASGWEVYDGTCENCTGIASTVVSDGGSNVWQLIDSHTSNRAKLRYTNSGGMNIDFTTGASIASRMRATGIGGTPTYNLGISNGNVGGMFLRLYTNEVRLVDINGTNAGSYALDATVYHKYQLTVKNATAGNNATAAWKVYVDGTLRISWTGAGVHNGFDGLMSGHAGTSATGTWRFDNIAGRSDGEFTPAQWDPVY